MTFTDENNADRFQFYRLASETFVEWDILFIRDRCGHEWYLYNCEATIKALNEYCMEHYRAVVSIGVSSGAFATLNIAARLNRFVGGWCFNGQSDLRRFVEYNTLYTDCWSILSENVKETHPKWLHPPYVSSIQWVYNAENFADADQCPSGPVVPVSLPFLSHGKAIEFYMTRETFADVIYPYLLQCVSSVTMNPGKE